MRRTLVDTSVSVEHFRGRRVPALEVLLRANAALLSPYVRLELLQAVRTDEARELAYLLGGIPQVPHRDDVFPAAEAMLEARLFGCAAPSFDRAFDRLAKLGLATLFRLPRARR